MLIVAKFATSAPYKSCVRLCVCQKCERLLSMEQKLKVSLSTIRPQIKKLCEQ